MTDTEIVDFLERHNFTFTLGEQGCNLFLPNYLGLPNGMRVMGFTLRDSVECLNEKPDDKNDESRGGSSDA